MGLENEFDATVVVDASQQIRLDRLREERNFSPEQSQAIMRAQMDPELKRERATHVLVNDGDIKGLEDQALEVLAQLRRNAVDRSKPKEGRLRIDMHMHTQTSFDCLSDPRKVLAAASARGVQRIAITDHNRVTTALDMAEAFPDSVIPGEEGQDEGGHRRHRPLHPGGDSEGNARRGSMPPGQGPGGSRLPAAPLCTREGRVRPLC